MQKSHMGHRTKDSKLPVKEDIQFMKAIRLQDTPLILSKDSKREKTYSQSYSLNSKLISES
jgi:hypothetical protein